MNDRVITYPSIITDMPEAEYFARPEMSKSNLWPMSKSERHFRYNLTKQPEPPTAAMHLGTVTDRLVLEPETFDDRYVCNNLPPKPPAVGRKPAKTADSVVWAEWAKRSKAMELWKVLEAELEEKGRNKEILDAGELYRAAKMCTALKEHPRAGRLIEVCAPQVSLFWEDEECGTGMRCKARVDMLAAQCRLMADLKTASDASKAGFARSAVNFGYHIQDAHYSAGVRACFNVDPTAMIFVVVESKFPFAVGCYSFGNDGGDYGISSREFAHGQYVDLMNRAKVALDADRTDRHDADGYGADIQTIEIPVWYQRQEDNK